MKRAVLATVASLGLLALPRAPLPHALARPDTETAGVDSRVQALEPQVIAALDAKKGKRALKLLREAADLGRPGWPLCQRIVTALMANLLTAKSPKEPGVFGLTMIEIVPAVSAQRLIPLYSAAIDDPSSFDTAFRVLAIDNYAYADRDGVTDILIRRLAVESEPRVVQAIAQVLGSGAMMGLLLTLEPEQVDTLVADLASQTSVEARRAIVDLLAGVTTEKAEEGLKTAAKDKDPGVRRAAELGLASHDVQTTGFFLWDIAPESTAGLAGLKGGDIITLVGTHSIEHMRDLIDTMGGLPPRPSRETTTLTVVRDGMRVEIRLAENQLWWVYSTPRGMAGRIVAPKARGR